MSSIYKKIFKKLKLDAKYKIWDCGALVPAYKRKPKTPYAVRLTCTNAAERAHGLRWYVPLKNLVIAIEQAK